MAKKTTPPDKAAMRAEVVAKITEPNIKYGTFDVVGTAPYVQLRFGQKPIQAMRKKQEAGGRAAKAKPAARDFDADYQDAFHTSKEGWYGIPCSGIRASMVRACKLAGFAMTDAKVTLFVEAEGFDSLSGEGLVQIHGKPEPWLAPVRNATGVADLRMRPRWDEWRAQVKIKFDADVFTATDVANILARAGAFVGWGEGRPDSKKSAGMGYGTFVLRPSKQKRAQTA